MQAPVELQVKRFDMKATAAGGRCITKRRPSSQLQPHKQGYFWSVLKDKDPNSSSDDKLLYEAEASDYQPIDRTSPVLVRGCDGETSKSSLTLPMATAIQHDHHRRSMTDLLDSLQGKIRNPHLKSKLVSHFLFIFSFYTLVLVWWIICYRVVKEKGRESVILSQVFLRQARI